MTLGQACTRHGIPENVCVACRGAREERERITVLARGAHPAIHNESPRPLCPVCVMLRKIEDEK